MTAFEVDVRAASVIATLRNGVRRMNYTIANALNTTAKLVQAEERAAVLRSVTVRRREFIERQAAIIKPFASAPQRRYFARIAIGQKPRFLLPWFETGATRKAFKGKNVAVPVVGGARPSKEQSVPEDLFVQKLRLRRQRRGRKPVGPKPPIEGERGTYIVPGSGIFQRIGDGASRILYAFKRVVRIPRLLRFMAIARTTAQRHFPRVFRAEVRKTLNFKRAA